MAGTDPIVRALTGRLPFLLLLAAALTWPVAVALLALYTRAVRRSMRKRTSGGPTAPDAGPLETSGAPEVGLTEIAAPPLQDPALHDPVDAPLGPEADALMGQLIARPRRAAAVYVAGGCVYALITAYAQLMAGGLEVLPVRFLMLFWVFGWPVVITVGLVGAIDRRGKLAITASYFIGLATIGAVGMRTSPDLTWGQVFQVWALYDAPGTILLLTYLSRRVRAVGPLILAFMFLALAGSDAIVTLAGSRDRYLRATIDVAQAVGLGSVGALAGLIAIGFAIFGAIAWVALRWIGRRYQAKKISDESVTIDAVWLLFTVVHSIDLVFGGPLWVLAGIAAFAGYKTCVRAGFWWLGRHLPHSDQGPTLLVLRSFSIGKDSERLFDVVQQHWRRSGSIQLIAGVDLARRTVEPHEFLDFASGKLARRFIDGPEALDRRLSERDTRCDRDLRFRVNDYFCYDDTWRTVLDALVHGSDAVLMDLRGFSRRNIGCVFEIGELVRQTPLNRVVFVVDDRTDEILLRDTLGRAASALAAGDAGRQPSSPARVFHLRSMSGTHLRPLLRALAAAAASGAAAGTW